MRIEIKENIKTKGYFTVIPHGPIDSDTHHSFKDELKSILKPATKAIVLNMKDVEYISSAGLGALFAIEKQLQEQGGFLSFCNLQPQIERLFDGVRMLPKNVIFKSLEEADNYFYSIMNEEIDRQKNKKKS